MAKTVHNDVLDAALNYVKTNGTRRCVCSQEPTTYTEATATYKLLDVDIISTDYTGPADGDSSGRKLTVNQKTGVAVDSSGTVAFEAIVDVSNTKLLYVTTVTSQVVTAGNTATLNSWKIEIADPS